jgi:hypothetical protein
VYYGKPLTAVIMCPQGILHCLKHNWERDGIKGLQRGLSYGIVREFMFNGCRIGLYDVALARYKSFQGTRGQTATASEQLIVGQSVGINIFLS